MPKPRIAIVCSSDNWAGTEKWTLRTCEQLVKRGREVKLICRNTELFLSRRTSEFPIEKLAFRNDADFISVLKLAGELKKSADIVILTRVRDYWLGGWAAKIAGIPVILRLGVVRRLRDNYLMDRLRYGIFPDAIVVNAGAIRDVLLKTSWIDEKNIHVIYNGVDAPGSLDLETKRKLRMQMSVSENEILIVGSGRLAVEKRWFWLVDAAAELIEKGYPATVRLMGEGSEKVGISARIAEKKMDKNFILLGGRKDSVQLQAAADVIALPSANEGISNTMLEAMGYAVPVVATISGGLAEFFRDGENILAAGKENFVGFLERLEKLVNEDDTRNIIGQAGYDTVTGYFNWDTMADSIETMIDEIMEKKK
ncbi:glycosyltransferase family 4 protein [Calditrichota bacterium]